MIINLVGPPTSGKSTFAARFVLKNPTWMHYSIDQCRDTLLKPTIHTEDMAWRKLKDLVNSYPRVILETGGLSWRLPILLEELTGPVNTTNANGYPWQYPSRWHITIMFTGKAQVFHKRLMQRHSWYQPKHYNLQDEHNAVEYTLDYMTNKNLGAAHTIRVDENTEDEVYDTLEPKILEFQQSCLKYRKEMNNESD